MPQTDVLVTGSHGPLLRLLAIHTAVVAAPVLLVGLALRLWVLALPLAVVTGVVVTYLRVRDIDDRVARMIGARPVSADDQPRLAGLAESVAMTVGVPVPRLFVIDAGSHNSLGWGAGDGPQCLAVTTALLDASGVVELEAIVGHHLGSAPRRSIDVTTLAAVLFGPFAKGPLAGPVVRLVQGEEDRTVVRADLDGVHATRYPPGLVAALEQLREAPTTLDAVPPAMTGLCFAAPRHRGDPFDVHPSVDDRVDLLREI